MCSGTILSLTPAKACSGKCKTGGCGNKSAIWVLAACEGMAALYQQLPSGGLELLAPENGNAMPLIGSLQHKLSESCGDRKFSQLLLVGSSSDIAWMMASLPGEVTQTVVAEIKYPLLPSWFKADPLQLQHVLENVLMR